MSGVLFRDLLTDGIYSIKIQENKPVMTIMDELGYAIGRDDGGPIIYWRRGNIPSKYEELELLVREIVKRGKCDKNWLERILFYAGYSSESLCNELFPSEKSDERGRGVILPYKGYWRLVGRNRVVGEILFYFKKDNHTIVSLDGVGGVGKSAIAVEVAHRCFDAGMFDDVVMVIANRPFASDSLGQGNLMTFESILDFIGTKVGNEDFANLKVKEKIQAVKTIFENNQILLILDNMETAAESQDEIIKQLQPILGLSKALLTSRHRFRGNFRRVHLDGLDLANVSEFIHQDAQSKGIEPSIKLEPYHLRSIVTATRGMPLALQLIVSQLDHLSLNSVLEYLAQVKPFAKTRQLDEYANLYKFVFHHSWQLLETTRRQVLLRMALFHTSDGSTMNALQAVTDIDASLLYASIEDLWDFSLLEVKRHPSSKVRYFLHPLTQNFVLVEMGSALE